MLQLIQSNRAEELLQRLAARLATPAPAGQSVLSAQTVLVQSQGMRQWLNIELARNNGIAANLDTPMPATFLWQICQQVMPLQISQASPFDKRAMSWHIMAILPGLLADAQFAPLQNFLSGQQHEQLHRYQLAYRIADVYDQYLVYRPDWILAWEQGEDGGLPAEQRWQAVLWRALVARVCGDERPMHRASIHKEACTRILKGEFDPGAIPEYIAVFGLSSLPPQQLDLLVALGEVCTVELYAMNPCAHYWGDIVSEKSRSRRAAAQSGPPAEVVELYLDVGNPLLASWGGQGREFFDLLLEREITSTECFVTSPPQTLLQVVQDDILRLRSRDDAIGNNALPAQPQYPLAATDESIQVHICHSPLREVEVLHDQVMAMLADDASLRPRDIIVMVPDIGAYAPSIHAVFSQRRVDMANLRYTISDRHSVDDTPVLRACLALVDLPRSRFSAPEIIDLLQLPAVARKFDFAAADVARLAAWIERSGIRWGRDAEHKQDWGLPGEGANTWQFGIDRLLLGYAMSSQHGIWRDILPCDEVDASSADLLGRLQQFLDLLWRWRQVLQTDHAWADWQRLLNNCWDDFFAPDEEESQSIDRLRQGVEELADDPAVAQLPESITPALLRSLLQQVVEQPGSNFGFLAGGVSFCTLMPMRSIPFRIICLLGMNDGEFPRQHSVPGFDLVANDKPRRGDRNRRGDDRYQMLEALLAARDRLYISYVGRDALDNSDKVASVLLSELLDYCGRAARCSGDEQIDPVQAQQNLLKQLLTHHHLQPFDARYFASGPSRWFSYAGEYYNAAARHSEPPLSWATQSLPAQSAVSQTIQVAHLLQFMGNACKAFLQQRLDIQLDIADGELSDTEVLQLDGLSKYLLGQDAVSSQLHERTQHEWQQLCYAAGQAPLGGPGELMLAGIWSQAEGLAQVVRPLLTGEAEVIAVSIEIAGWHLEGEVGPLFGDKLVNWRPGEWRKSQLLQQWLRHVLANACVGPVTTCLADKRGLHTFAPIGKDQALDWLQTLLDWYALGMTRPLPLLPETAWRWLEEMTKTDDSDAAQTKAMSTWSGNSGFGFAEGNNVWFGRCFSIDEVFTADFSRLTAELVEPAFLALESSA
jgi:exodeoxyribonuclease V gamma subunit